MNDDLQQVQDLWEMVRVMVDVPPTVGAQALRQNPNTQKAFVRNARSHLEQSYVTVIVVFLFFFLMPFSTLMISFNVLMIIKR